jgi:hypothetical protein
VARTPVKGVLLAGLDLLDEPSRRSLGLGS